MRRRRGTAAISASPVLVGAVAVLVSCIAVMIAVQANSGLPFVPSYDVNAEIPGGSNLVVGNEVRIGGFRVGVVDTIAPAVSEAQDGRAVAVIHMKLEKKYGELPSDTELAIRPRSALGLKYIELQPGNSARTLRPGETIALAQSTKPIELDEFFSTWNDDMRRDQRTTLEGYGNALAGRGSSINSAIEDLVPFMTHLEPVMRSLSDRDTELDNFFPQLRRTAGQIAPVADTYAELFGNMATTFEALSRHEQSLRDTIERAPDTLEAGIQSFPVQRPFLRDSGELAVKLEPVAEEIERSLPKVADAFDVGAPVLEKAPPFYERTERVFNAVEGLMENPNTLLALRDLDRLLEVAAPLVEFVAPYQTVCNYWVYYWTGISEHVSEPVRGGTVQRTNLKSDNRTQDNRLSSSEAERPVDVPKGQDPHDAKAPNGDALQALHGGAYGSAIDAQGNADCVVGQRGYLEGPMQPGARYGPDEDGGQHVVWGPFDLPGLMGGTYKARELGIDNLEDVP
jgi:virulence factor Mce-like protein